MTLLHDYRRPDAEAAVRTMLHRLAAGRDHPPARVGGPHRAGGGRGRAPRPVRADHRARDPPPSLRPPSPDEGGGRRRAGVRRSRCPGRQPCRLRSHPSVRPPRPSARSPRASRPSTPPRRRPSGPRARPTRRRPLWPTSPPWAFRRAPRPPPSLLQGITGTSAVVDWSLAADESHGTVYLRSSSDAGTPRTWTVVGSAAADIALGEVRYDGSRLSFTVTRTAAGPQQVAVGAWIDGQPVALGGEPVAWAGSGDVSLGELVDLGTGRGAVSTLGLPADADDIVTLRVVRVVDGTVRSLTQMAVALPDAAPAPTAAGAPSPRRGRTGGRGRRRQLGHGGGRGRDRRVGWHSMWRPSTRCPHLRNSPRCRCRCRLSSSPGPRHRPSRHHPPLQAWGRPPAHRRAGSASSPIPSPPPTTDTGNPMW